MTTNHIDTVRQHLLDQMAALRGAKGDALPAELERAKGLSELAQVAVNTAEVEVDYLRATEQRHSPFLGKSQDALPNGIVSITRHTLGD